MSLGVVWSLGAMPWLVGAAFAQDAPRPDPATAEMTTARVDTTRAGATLAEASRVGLPQPLARYPVAFVHVDRNDGEAGLQLAAAIRQRIGKSDALRLADGSAMVLWLRTLSIPSFVAGSGNVDAEPIGVAYSVVVDVDGRHVTDNLGFAQPDATDDAAARIVDEVIRFTSGLAAH